MVDDDDNDDDDDDDDAAADNDDDDDDVFSEILRDIKQSGEIHLVVDCQLERVGQVLKVSTGYYY